MQDFRKHLEQGKQAKEGSISFERFAAKEEKPKTSGNRIEDMLLDLREAHSTSPVIPEVRKVEKVEARTAAPEKEARKRSFKQPLLILISIILLGGIGYGGYYAYERFFPGGSNENAVLLKSVDKLVGGLPKGEKPTIATVTNLEPIKDQPFFQNAKIGDKVLIFGTSKKAILYRPSTNTIISVAPLNQ